MKQRVLVSGAGGFIGHHLVNYLKQMDYWVRGVDIKKPEYSKTSADEFLICDLRKEEDCQKSLLLEDGESFDEVYHLAADMGGMGFIHSAECEIMRNNVQMNVNMPYFASLSGVRRYFFSSSVCIYRDMDFGELELSEEDAYPAMPDNEYGWEKLYAERVALAYGRNKDMTVRVARFQNCYGSEGTWRGGREKAPAAICRKIAEVEDGGTIDVWGDGTAVRAYTHVSDMVDGIYRLMQSDLEGPVNIGTPEYVSVAELVELVSKASGKRIQVNYIPGPVGVKSRNFSNRRIYSTGWRPKVFLEEGIGMTYAWIEKQIAEQVKECNENIMMGISSSSSSVQSSV